MLLYFSLLYLSPDNVFLLIVCLFPLECGFHEVGECCLSCVQSPQCLVLLQSMFSIKVERETEDGGVVWEGLHVLREI